MDEYVLRPWEEPYTGKHRKVGRHRKPKDESKIIRRVFLVLGGLALASVVAVGWLLNGHRKRNQGT